MDISTYDVSVRFYENRTEPLFLLSWIDAQMSLFPFIKDKLLLKNIIQPPKTEQRPYLVWGAISRSLTRMPIW